VSIGLQIWRFQTEHCNSAERDMSQNVLSNRPLYLQVRDALVERIAEAIWKPGVSIPNEGDLAREFGVSPGTMRKALDLIEGEHLITRRQGRGTFVNDQGSDRLASRFNSICGADGELIVSQIIEEEITEGEANDMECRRLRLQAADNVFRISRVHAHAGQTFMFEETSMPASLFPGLLQKTELPQPLAVVAQRHGVLLGKAQERISVGRASTNAAAVLGIAPRGPILELDRVILALNGRPIEWRISQCNLLSQHYLAEVL